MLRHGKIFRTAKLVARAMQVKADTFRWMTLRQVVELGRRWGVTFQAIEFTKQELDYLL